MHTRVTVIGEALIDIVVTPDGHSAEHVGGSPANVAVGLARLGHVTELATHIGTDPRGVRIAELMEAEDVTLTPGSTSAGRTPTATAHLDSEGVATYDFDLEWRLVAPPITHHVHTGSIAATLAPGATQVASAVHSSRDVATVSYDPNARPSLMGSPEQARPVIESLIAAADLVKASEEDIAWLYEGEEIAQVLTRWQGWGPSVCVATRGGEAAVIRVGDETHVVPTRPTTVVDTVGAGDSFMAGLISALLDAGLLGGPQARTALANATWTEIEPAIERALACAAVTVSRAGANPPTRAEL